MATREYKSANGDGPHTPGGKRWKLSRDRGYKNPKGLENLETLANQSGTTQHAKRRNDWGSYRVTIEGKMAALCRGDLTVEDMDDEELARMQFRAADGTFKGRAPSHVPVEVFRKVQAEIVKRGDAIFWGGSLKSREEIVRQSTRAEKESDRFKAGVFIDERLRGKSAERIDIDLGLKPYQKTMARGIRRFQPEDEEDEDADD